MGSPLFPLQLRRTKLYVRRLVPPRLLWPTNSPAKNAIARAALITLTPGTTAPRLVGSCPDPANFGAVDEYPQTWNAYPYVGRVARMTNPGPFKLVLIVRRNFRTLTTQTNTEGAPGSSSEPGSWGLF